MEYIHKRKSEAARANELAAQAEARREKVKAMRAKREERQRKRREELIALQSEPKPPSK